MLPGQGGCFHVPANDDGSVESGQPQPCGDGYHPRGPHRGASDFDVRLYPLRDSAYRLDRKYNVRLLADVNI